MQTQSMRCETEPEFGMDDRLDELSELLALYRRQLAAWIATAGKDGELDADCPEYDAMERTTIRIVALPCGTRDVARRKVDAVLEFSGLYTAVKEGAHEDTDYMRLFLASLFNPEAHSREEE